MNNTHLNLRELSCPRIGRFRAFIGAGLFDVGLIRGVRRLAFLCLTMACIVSALDTRVVAQDVQAEPAGSIKKADLRGSVPAFRQADRIAVITMRGVIDSVTSHSVQRRIKAAEASGFDAMVIEIDSPGGELGAVLEISNAIKQSSILNSVAWIHPDAYSGGAIVGLACREMVQSRPSSFGDAFVIQVGLGQVKALTPTERTKFLPPLMADVTDSARRSGYDEYLVQAIVVDGIELWMVEDLETGERLSVNEEEYRLLFGDEVIRGKPMLAAVTGGVQTYYDPEDLIEEDQEGDIDETEEQTETDDGDVQGDEDLQEGEEEREEVVEDKAGEDEEIDSEEGNELDNAASDPNAYQPASPTLWDVEQVLAERGDEETEQVVGLENPSNRRVIKPGDRGKFGLIGYITDGSSAIVMRDEQLEYFGFSKTQIQNDEELLAFFGGELLVRTNMSGTEYAIRFMTSMPVRFFLIAVFLIAAFAEMLTSGTGLAGGVAVGALVLLIAPGAMIGLTGWWTLIAIVLGLGLLGVELFVTPGLGLFGVLGLVLIFAGLVGVFVDASSGFSDPQTQRDIGRGALVVVMSFITAGIGWWLLVRNMHSLPIFDRFVLSGASGVGGMPAKSMLHAIPVDDGSVKIGDIGETTTPLLPIGQAMFGDELIDVHAGIGTIDRGVEVRVTSVSSMRIEVEVVDEQIEGQAEEQA